MIRIVTLLVAIALSMTACSASAAPAPPPLGVASIATLIDRTGAGYDTEAQKIRDVGASWIRIVMNWNEIETARGVYAWSRIDTAVGAARRHKLSVLALITGPAPPWAGRAPFDGASPPRDPTDYADFSRALAQRYGSMVKAWEIWNEPNLPGSWASPDPTDYVRTLRAAYPAIKSAEPGATVVLGGLSTNSIGVSIANFLTGVYAAGGGDYFDAAALHPYTYPNPLDSDPAGRQRVITQTRDLMARNGQSGKKIWITEFGQSTGTSSISVSEARQADIVMSGLRYLRTLRSVGPVFLFTSKDWTPDPAEAELNYGLYRFDYSPKPIVARLQSD